MKDWMPIIVAAIAALPALIGSIIMIVRLNRVHDTFNSKMDRMLALTQTVYLEIGKREGRAEEKKERAEEDKAEAEQLEKGKEGNDGSSLV